MKRWKSWGPRRLSPAVGLPTVAAEAVAVGAKAANFARGPRLEAAAAVGHGGGDGDAGARLSQDAAPGAPR